MCVSTTASLAVAILAAGMGVVSVRSVRDRREWLLATLPFGFAMHQVAEAVTWSQLGQGAALCQGPNVTAYVVFAYLLVPFWLGVGAALVEPRQRRRAVMWTVAVVAAAAMAWSLRGALAGPSAAAWLAGGHVAYVVPLLEPAAALTYFGAYLAVMFVPLLGSSWPWLRALGVLGVGALLGTQMITSPGWPSLWCWAAAGMSPLIAAHLRTAQRTSAVPDGLRPPGARGGERAASGAGLGA